MGDQTQSEVNVRLPKSTSTQRCWRKRREERLDQRDILFLSSPSLCRIVTSFVAGDREDSDEQSSDTAIQALIDLI
jgi:hypothetical protein